MRRQSPYTVLALSVWVLAACSGRMDVNFAPGPDATKTDTTTELDAAVTDRIATRDVPIVPEVPVVPDVPVTIDAPSTTDVRFPVDVPAGGDVPTAHDVPSMVDAHASSDGGGACSPRPLPSRTGMALATGSTETAAMMHEGSCGGDEAPEVVYSWTAPAAGEYSINTAGSDYDTLLYVRDGTCAGPELDCSDDSKDVTSEVILTLRAGQTVAIFVDGYADEAGSYVLNIVPAEPAE